MGLGIVIAALMSMLLVMVEHWLPWKEVLGKKLPRTAAYVLGTAAILLPLTGLLILAREIDRWGMLAALWAVTAAAGAGTALGYLVDGWLEMRVRLSISEKEAQELRPGVDDGEDPR